MSNTKDEDASFFRLALRSFWGYFIFFVSPNLASDHWDKILNGKDSTPLPEDEKKLRSMAFGVGMLLGPVVIFFLCIALIALYFRL